MDSGVMNRSIAIAAIVPIAVLVITDVAINQDAVAKCKGKKIANEAKQSRRSTCVETGRYH
jgi:hypothetical protein